MRYDRIELERIVASGPEAERFVFTFRPDLSDLLSSIDKVGLLVPPVLRERATGECQVVCGSRRVRALRLLGKKNVESLVGSEEEMTDLDCLRRSLLENRFHRGYNEVERALLVTRLQDEFSSLVPLLGDVLEGELKIPKDPSTVEDYRFLLCLSESVRVGVAQGRITFGQALLLKGFRREFDSGFFRLVAGCGLNSQESRQAAEWIREICVRDRKDPLGLLETLPLDYLLAERIPPRKRAQRLFSVLRQERFPVLDSWRSRFEKACELAGIEKEGIQVVRDPSFETTRIRIQVSANSEQEMKGRVEAIHRAAEQGKLKELFLAVHI